MSTVQDFTMTYDALNEQRTFSEGDTITGTVILNLLKDATVQAIYVKAKGDANVHWSEKQGEHQHSYSAHKRYFKAKEFLIPENTKDTQLSKGIHKYRFSLKIPTGSMPSSFKGLHGKIVYMLEAKLERSWKMDRTVSQQITFASKAISNLSHLMTRQVGSIDKDVGVFSKGSVHMEASIQSRVYAPGDTVAISVKVNNQSSKDMTPKYSLKQKIMFHANSRSKHAELTICKYVGEVIEKKTERTISCALEIPRDTALSIQNCDIISVENQLKVYLDISFASDPEIKFPVVIAAAGFASIPGPGGSMQPYPPVAYGGPSSSDFPPPAAYYQPPPQNAYGHPAAFGPGHSAAPQQPPPYLAYPPMPGAQAAMAPAYPVVMGTVYHNPMPEKVSPYGPPAPSSSSPSHHQAPPPTAPFPPASAPMLNPTPSAPPPFGYPPSAPMYDLPQFMSGMNTDFLSQQNEEPPPYLSMFPPPTTDKPKE